MEPVAATPLSEVAAVVAKCRAAQPNWARAPSAEREAKLRLLAQAILTRHEELSRILSEEMGRSELECLGG